MKEQKIYGKIGNCVFLNEETQTLDEVKVAKIVIDNDNNNVLYYGENDKLIGVNIKKWYNTKEDYESGLVLGGRNPFFEGDELAFVKVPAFLVDYYVKDEEDEISLEQNEDGEIGLYAWIWVNNTAQEVFLPLTAIILTKCLPRVKVEHNENVTYYRTRKDAFKGNEYVVRHEDGTTHTEVGIGKSIELTDEQKELVKKFTAVAKELKEAKVGLYLDYEGMGVRAYNKAHGAKIAYEYEVKNKYNNKEHINLLHSLPLADVDIDYANYLEYYFLQGEETDN